MDVTCKECGVKAEIMDPVSDGDPKQDGWLYETEDVEELTTVKAPNGDKIEVPYVYKKQVSRSVVWLCENGHTNVLTEEIADA